MRILGIDPGIGRVGWGVVEKQGMKISPVGYGCIETKAKLPVPKRLQEVYDAVVKIIDEYQPVTLGIEELFFNTNAKTAFVVGQARGVILLASEQKKLSIGIYTPLQVKIAVAGYGRAEKGQVGQMVKTILKLPSIPKPDDTTDALAVAIAHAFTIRK